MNFMSKGLIILSLSASLVLASCASTSPLASFVPADAVGVVKIDSLKGLTTNVNGFMTAIDLASVLPQGKTSEEFINPALEQLGIKSTWLDWEKPILMVVTKAQGDTQTPVTAYFCLPLLDGEKNIKTIQDALAQGEVSKSLFVNGYLVLFPAKDPSPVFPITKTMDLTLLDAQEKGGIAYLFSLPNLTAAVGPQWQEGVREIKDQINKAFALSATELSPSQGEALAKVFNSIIDGLLQINQIAGVFKADALGFISKYTMDFTSGGTMDKTLKTFKSLKGTKDMTKYLIQDAFINGASNLDPDTVITATAELESMYLKAMGLSPELEAKISQATNAMYKSLGNKSSFTLDINPDITKLMGMLSAGPDPKMAAEYFKVLGIRMLMVMETKDPVAYKKAMTSLYQENALNEMMAGVFRGSALPLDLQYTFTGNQKDGDFVYDTIGTKFSLLPADKDSVYGDPSTRAVMTTMFDVFNNILKIDHSIKGNKAYMSFTSQGIADLKDLVNKDTVAPNLSSAKAIKDLESVLPDDATILVSLSPWKLMQKLSESLPMLGSFSLPEGAENLGLAGFGKVADGKVESGFGMRAVEIKAVIKTVYSLMGLMALGGN